MNMARPSVKPWLGALNGVNLHLWQTRTSAPKLGNEARCHLTVPSSVRFDPLSSLNFVISRNVCFHEMDCVTRYLLAEFFSGDP